MSRILIASLLSATGLLPCATTGVPVATVVLPAEAGRQVGDQCSRTPPPPFSALWEPTEQDVSRLESRLGALAKLRSEGCCLRGHKLSSLSGYYLQYVGLVVGGRRVVYVNGFRASETPANWRGQPEVACDGGTDYWGAIFDPATSRFSLLSINGVS